MNPEPTDLNDLAAIARTTKSARYTVIVDKEEEREGLWLIHGRILKEDTDER